MKPSPSRPGALLFAGALAAALPVAGAHAQSPATQTATVYDLPAAPLADTLSRISLQSGRTISTRADLVAGKQAAAVRGATSPEAAARQALAGTGLELVVTPGGVMLERHRTGVPGPAPSRHPGQPPRRTSADQAVTPSAWPRPTCCSCVTTASAASERGSVKAPLSPSRAAARGPSAPP